MAGERISDLPEITSIANDEYLMIDNIKTSTSKIKSSDLLAQLQKDIISYNSASLVKLSSGDFDLKSNGYLQFSVSPTLYDGYTLTFTTSGLEYNWQTKVNPTINVDGTGAKSLINGVFFDFNPYDADNSYSSQALDVNSVGNGKHTVVYNATIDKWLLYKDYATSGTIIASPHALTLAGMEQLNGNTHTLGNRPLLELAFPTFGNATPDLANASLAGYGDETPMGVISEGQVGATAGANINVTGTFSGVGEGTGTGAFTSSQTQVGAFDSNNRQIPSNLYTMSSTVVGVKIGNETLTRRIGVQFYWVL